MEQRHYDPRESFSGPRAAGTALAQAQYTPDRPPEVGMLTSLSNDLLSLHNRLAQLRARMAKLSSAIFGENTVNVSEVKAECTKVAPATVTRLQETVELLSKDADILHEVVNRLEKLV